ncbi:hypothetical protein T492DRAFT_843633 [Pavlovales sp. CCMP2436]|nr:hypothetical protein T492DRAFT_843633 [Pavlovales sp. CCMP2436]
MALAVASGPSPRSSQRSDVVARPSIGPSAGRMLERYFLRHLPHAVADPLAAVLCFYGALPAATELASTFCDYSWWAAARSLQFLPGGHGLSRRCKARALHLAPQFAISVPRSLPTAKVNGGRCVAHSGCRPVPPARSPSSSERCPRARRTALRPDPPHRARAGRALGEVPSQYQHTRGRFGSDGEFMPVEHERADGAETVWWGGLSLELIVLWFFVVMRVLAEHSPLAQARTCDLTTQSWLPPMHLVTCWFDFFASECLRDYEVSSKL